MNIRILSRLAGASLFSFLAIAVGCGGGGTNPPPSVYAGTYSGAMVNSANSTIVQSVNFTVSGLGAIQGTVFGAKNLAISGKVSNNGTATITIAGTAGTFVGSLSNPSANSVYGALSNATQTTTNYLALDVNPGPVSGASLFSGDYAGTEANKTNNEIGPVAISIDNSGNITGYGYAILTGKSYALVKLTGTITNAGVINLAGTSGGTSAGSGKGTLTLTSSTLSGNMVFTNGASVTDGSLALTVLGQ